ncbi:hypothetical protein BB347_05930 [Natronorubrum daqingense]|uniref:HTH bat-type domain-containing protein n=1 Tax=Natronorubrum daqingense TaxID=588898 RepID=A0A1P8RC27_9EURY|nr:hypothetical protein BB347_05930 [Natronorubrum daqingense]
MSVSKFQQRPGPTPREEHERATSVDSRHRLDAGREVRHRPRDRSTTTDVRPLTAKQREALELAYELGYYRRPRAVRLGTVAT